MTTPSPSRVVTGTVLFLVAALACGAPGSAPGAIGTANPTPRVDCRDPNLVQGKIPPAPGVKYETLTVAGALRDFRVFVAPSLNEPAPIPLVIQLHGSPATAAEFQAVTHFDDEAANAKFLAAYPDGCDGYWNAGRCCTAKADDVAFIGSVIDRMEAEYPVDPTRVYIVGASAGSMMGYRLACELTARIAAFASDAGTMVNSSCHPSRPVSIFEMHGTNDADIPYEGGHASIGVNGPSVSAVIQDWLRFDGCSGDPTPAQHGITKTSLWKNCRGGSSVRLDTVVGGLHQWFGSDYAPVPGEPNFSDQAWSFFRSIGASS
jgi:polyhydroxybutyrate depolymerase